MRHEQGNRIHFLKSASGDKARFRRASEQKKGKRIGVGITNLEEDQHCVDKD